MKKTIYSILLFLFILLAFFPRSVELLNQNPVFTSDEGRDMLEVKNIVVNHNVTLIGAEIGGGGAGISYLFQGPVYYYIMTIPYIFTHGNPAGEIAVMWTLSMLTLVFGYYAGCKIWGKWGGFLVFALFVLCQPLIDQARIAINSHSTGLFILLAMYSVYLYIKTRQLRYSFLSAFFAGFIYNFEFAVAVPLCVTYIVLLPFFAQKKVIHYFSALAGFLVAFSPMILFEIRHGFLGTKSVISYVTNNHSVISISFLARLLHLQQTVLAFLYNFRGSFPSNALMPVGFLIVPFIICIIWYFLKEKDKTKKDFFTYLVLLTPIAFFVFLFLKTSVYPQYLTELTISYLLISVALIHFFITNTYSKILFILGIYGTVLFVTTSIWAYKTTVYDFTDYGGVEKLKGKIDATDFIYQDAHGQPFSLFVFTPPVYTYAYDYVVQWYGYPKYHYLPGNSKKGTIYLLIKIDPLQQWSYKGWLETVIKTGKVVYTKTLPSGFIVQKRIGA